jgi:hypothetical protein
MEEPQIPIEPPPPIVNPRRNLTPYLIIGGTVAFLIIIIVGLIIGLTLLPKPVKKDATPVIPPAPLQEAPIIKSPSRFASDSGLLKIESDLKSIRTKIDTTDLFDAQISPPNLDLNINIK